MASKYWINISKPLKTVRIHLLECRYCRPRDTPFKGLNRMGPEGGWYGFDTYQRAVEYYREHHPDMAWKTCKTCNP
jgi:hypothetical protein